jgi:metal-responsive CopG/Arc/MetJ family transcriptional regulator
MNLLMENMMMTTLAQFETIRTTVTIPMHLMQRSQHFLEKGIIPNRNALVVAALEHFLAELERQEIDRQFAAMVDDVEYQTLNEQLAESFDASDWEALRLAEKSA